MDPIRLQVVLWPTYPDLRQEGEFDVDLGEDVRVRNMDSSEDLLIVTYVFSSADDGIELTMLSLWEGSITTPLRHNIRVNDTISVQDGVPKEVATFTLLSHCHEED